MMTTNDVIKIVKSIVRPVLTSTRLMIGRGIISMINDAGGLQTAQVDLNADETQDSVEIWQQYGIACNPPEDSECVFLSVGGQRDNAIAICPQHAESRPRNIPNKNVALYNDKGVCLILNQSQSFSSAFPSEFAARADKVLEELEKIKTAFDTHVHTSGTPGNPTLQPSVPMTAPSEPACEGVKIR